jgi:hypothetical protein
MARYPPGDSPAAIACGQQQPETQVPPLTGFYLLKSGSAPVDGGLLRSINLVVP